jgi:hypothetical protein
MGGRVKWALILGICYLALACNLVGMAGISAATPTSGRLVETPQASVNPTETQAIAPQAANPSPEASLEAQTLQPCTLITQQEAAALLETDVQAPQDINGACAYNSQPDGIYLVSVSAAQGAETENILQALFLLAGLAGAKIDQAELERLQSLAVQQDFKGFFEGLVADTQGLPSLKTRLLEGSDEAGYWAWLITDSRAEGVLAMARGDKLVNVNLIVAGTKDEEAALEAARAQADLAFQRLPARFTLPVATETPAPSQTPTPTQTLVPTPTLVPSSTPTGYYEQASYTGDCKQRPTDSVCLGFDDGFVWFIQPFNDAITGWGRGDSWQGKVVQVAYGQHADYYHVLNTNLVMLVAH